MKLLAIEASTEIASLALLNGEKLLLKEQASAKTQAQMILPMIDELMDEGGLHGKELDAIVFGCGPGSFTGLRIACSIAKGLAYAHDLNLIPVSSLAAITWAARKQDALSNSPILAVLDARMHEMYWAYYDIGSYSAEERVNPVGQMVLLDNNPIVLAGVGIEEYWDDFPSAIQAQVSAKLNIYPNAAAMIELATATSIKSVTVGEAQPVYVRNKVTYDKQS